MTTRIPDFSGSPGLSDPLAGLRDWHLPAPVSWWPPAPGWWILAALTVIVLAWAVRRWRGIRRHDAPVRAALRELESLRTDFATDGDVRRLVPGLSQLLRRLALARYPRARVAGLGGAAWLDFLDATGGAAVEAGGGGGFARGPGRALVEVGYRPEPPEPAPDVEALLGLARDWIRAQRGGRAPLAMDIAPLRPPYETATHRFVSTDWRTLTKAREVSHEHEQSDTWRRGAHPVGAGGRSPARPGSAVGPE